MTRAIKSISVRRPPTDMHSERNSKTGSYEYTWKTTLATADLKAMAAYINAIADSPVAGTFTVGQLVLEVELAEEPGSQLPRSVIP
jgi:hypothetical protein